MFQALASCVRIVFLRKPGTTFRDDALIRNRGA
ncbi:UNVERIFIED_ORG: hypothetical protein M2438_003925 [Methylobacterium sp. SuP10 SLI 274]|nr:hypothetical protein [Methylorubrum extorquens]MDF9793476.1 hypothetical protein [Methylorubrum extorquens]MDF9865181.1 hypothetical protein [Methylorubrum pseudosasae]MDH6638750.1 hypothetical protein [Methylobacterium sp. SuP10 SLI 274]MDH6667938.1 hypothetical protein [Methylorubrum zatmanii]